MRRSCRHRSSYPNQRLGHAFPVLCPARVLLYRIPLGPRPSLPRLRSQSPALFVGLSATTAESDLPRLFVIAYGSSLPDSDQRLVTTGQTRDLPVPVQRASTHARFSDHAGSSRRSRSRPCLHRLPPSQGVGTRDMNVYEAQWLAYVPCRRFAAALAGDRAHVIPTPRLNSRRDGRRPKWAHVRRVEKLIKRRQPRLLP